MVRAHSRACVLSAREALPQLNGGRELAALLVDGADRGSIRLGDGKYRREHGDGGPGRQAWARPWSPVVGGAGCAWLRRKTVIWS